MHTHPYPCSLSRSSAPSAVRGSGCQGRRRASAPLAGRNVGCRGRRRVSAPLAGRETGCRGRRRVSAPLAGRKTGCRGRRKGPAPLAAIVFIVRWPRWDFRGCTRYTHNGSGGVLRQGRWTWSTERESLRCARAWAERRYGGEGSRRTWWRRGVLG